VAPPCRTPAVARRGSAGPTVTGFIATLAAMVATTLVAALAQAGGVDFEIPDGGGTIP
jgi:hypothetical protein